MNKITHQVKAVIFDMDGVITNTMPDHHRAWKEVLAEYDIHVSHADIYTREGQPGDEALVEIFEKYDSTHRLDEIPKILRQKEDLFKEIVRIRYVPHSRTLLKSLYKQGFKLALVTGTARHELDRMLPGHIYELFSAVVTGNDVTRGKPHPEPFLTALKNLDMLAQDAIVIENAPYGIRSAKQAGLKCMALETSLSRDYLAEADHVFSSVKDLINRIHFKFE